MQQGQQQPKLVVSLPQRFHKLGDKMYNLKLIEEEVESCEAGELLVFPELFLTGYACRDAYLELAELAEGKSVQRLAAAVKHKRCNLIFGMPERDPLLRGYLYNSAVYINAAGEIRTYRKMHLVNFGPFEEKRYFRLGRGMPLFELQVKSSEVGAAGEKTGSEHVIRFGVIVCYDIFFPELAKSYALRGADLLVCISASPSITRKFFETLMLARAIETTTFFVYSNLIGCEYNMTFWGGSAVIGPRGEVKARCKYYEEDKVKCTLDLQELLVARAYRPVLEDTQLCLFPRLLPEDVHEA